MFLKLWEPKFIFFQVSSFKCFREKEISNRSSVSSYFVRFCTNLTRLFGKTPRPLISFHLYLCWHWRKHVQFNNQSRYPAPAQPWHYIEDRGEPWHYGNCLHGITPTALFTSVRFHCCCRRRGAAVSLVHCPAAVHSQVYKLTEHSSRLCLAQWNHQRTTFHWALPYLSTAVPVYDGL